MKKQITRALLVTMIRNNQLRPFPEVFCSSLIEIFNPIYNALIICFFEQFHFLSNRMKLGNNNSSTSSSGSYTSMSSTILRRLKAEEISMKSSVIDKSTLLKSSSESILGNSPALQAATSLPHLHPPSCLSKFPSQGKNKNGFHSSGELSFDLEGKRRELEREKALNSKLTNSLFLSKLDTEELRAALEHIPTELGIDENSNTKSKLLLNREFSDKYYHLAPSSPIAMDSTIDLFSDLTDHDMDTYFGQEARVDFFEKYRSMVAAKMKISTSEIIGGKVIQNFPDVIALNEESESEGGEAQNDESVSMSASSHKFFSGSTNSASDTYVTRIMNRNCDAFYGELQQYVSGEAVNREVDQTLLSFDSFDNYRQKFEGVSSIAQIGGTLKSKKHGKNSNNKRKHPRSKGVRLPPLSPLKESSWLTFDNSSMSSEVSLLSRFTDGNGQPSSPRTKYLSGCIRDGLLPLPNLILRKNFTKTINLEHNGMGDKMGRVLAECLEELPLIESVNLNDNNLTDDSLKYLITALINIKTLTSLNLSRNKIDGESSDALAEYVSREDCPLLVLTLQSADVDDGECDRFVQCLVSNRKLRNLDMSANLLGTAESKGDPTAPSGPGSIATYLKSTSCQLEVLKLAWNSIRLKSAVVLTSSLAFNNTVTYLDISCNGLGWAAGEVLGDALMENRTLQTLIASNNNFSSTSIMSICIGIAENIAMKRVDLNENPIGIAGARAILQLSMVVGSRVTVSATNCNTIVNDERCWYDPDQPCKEYELDLSRAFDRAVAFHLMQTIANHSTYVFEYVTLEESGARQPKSLNLKQVLFSDREKYFDAEQVQLLAGLRRLKDAASNVELGTQLFHEADADDSGKLDKFELQTVLKEIGFEIDEEQLNDIFTVFDVDGAGAIDKAEFLSLLKAQRHEATLRINDMISYPVMTLDGKRFIPPRKGILRMKIADGFVRKKAFYTLSSLDTKYAYRMAKGIGDVTMMTDATKNTKTRYNEAYNIYKTMYKELGDKAAVLIKVVPGMMNPADARQLVSKVTNDDRIEIARIKMAFGASYRPLLGSFNGYYALDLSKDIHRMCLARLLEQSQTMNHKRKSNSIIGFAKVGDVSQHGNWTSFRNEMFNGEPIEITPARFTPIPHSGILEFDFSGGNRPTGGELVLSDRRLCHVLDNINLVKVHDEHGKPVSGVGVVGTKEWIMDTLAKWGKKARLKSQDGRTPMPMFAPSVQSALEIGLAADDFYNNLSERGEMHRKGIREEEIKYDFMSAEPQNNPGGKKKKKRKNQISSPTEPSPSTEPFSPVEKDSSAILSASNTSPDSPDENESEENEASDDLSIQSSQDSVNSNEQQISDAKLAIRQRKIAELKLRFYKLLHFKKGISIEAKASRFADLIDETFSQLWLLSRHVAVIVLLFKQLFGDSGRSEFYGTYTLDAVVYLFARIIDLHNFEVVLETLSNREIAVLYGRIGILNIYNPMKPETTLELCLDRRDERVVAKMIVYLSADEPGINLTYKRFQWKRELDPTPGWDVTEAWMTDEGLYTHGYFCSTYYSGEGRNKFGCVPNMTLRRALLQMVLIDENEVVDEDEAIPDEYMNTGTIHYEQNTEIWHTLLLGNGKSFS